MCIGTRKSIMKGIKVLQKELKSRKKEVSHRDVGQAECNLSFKKARRVQLFPELHENSCD